jgi:ribosome-binding protein aMBF1 (putative translation factor)
MSGFANELMESEAAFIQAARKPRSVRSVDEEALLPHVKHRSHGNAVEMVSLTNEICGDVLRSERLARGWTATVLARRIHGSVTLVSRIEHGEGRFTPMMVARFAKAFDMRTSALLHLMATRLEDVNE